MRHWLALVLLLAMLPAAGGAELVMFETDGCPWCEAWEREVGVIYGRTAEGARAPLTRLDLAAPRPPGLRLAAPVIYTPTFVLVERGRELGRITGYPGEMHFWGLLGALLERNGL